MCQKIAVEIKLVFYEQTFMEVLVDIINYCKYIKIVAINGI